jgi:hypothetical protein
MSKKDRNYTHKLVRHDNGDWGLIRIHDDELMCIYGSMKEALSNFSGYYKCVSEILISDKLGKKIKE